MNKLSSSPGIFTAEHRPNARTWDEWPARVTGISAEAGWGRPLPELIPSLVARGLLSPFERAPAEGVVEVLAPALHQYLIPCSPHTASPHFDRMQQHVTIAPIREAGRVLCLIVTIEDVTARANARRRGNWPARTNPCGCRRRNRRRRWKKARGRRIWRGRSATKVRACAPPQSALTDAHAWMRYQAVRAVGEHGYSESLETLAGDAARPELCLTAPARLRRKQRTND